MQHANGIPVLPMNDERNLRLLSIFHYVSSGVLAIIGSFPLLYILLGFVFLANPEGINTHGESEEVPTWFPYLFMGLGVFLVAMGWTLAILTFLSARKLAKLRNRTFSLVTAGLLCLIMPLGTILGVITILILCRDSVIQLYQRKLDQEIGA